MTLMQKIPAVRKIVSTLHRVAEDKLDPYQWKELPFKENNLVEVVLPFPFGMKPDDLLNFFYVSLAIPFISYVLPISTYDPEFIRACVLMVPYEVCCTNNYECLIAAQGLVEIKCNDQFIANKREEGKGVFKLRRQKSAVFFVKGDTKVTNFEVFANVQVRNTHLYHFF